MNATDELIHAQVQADEWKRQARRHEQRNKETNACLNDVQNYLKTGRVASAVARIELLHALREDAARISTESSTK